LQDIIPWPSLVCVANVDFYLQLLVAIILPFVLIGILALILIGIPACMQRVSTYADK
jgi:hypothetical protein